MVLSIIVSLLGLIQFSLGIVAADNDSVSNRKGVLGFEGMPPEYDIYAEKNNPWKYYCTGENNMFNWVYTDIISNVHSQIRDKFLDLWKFASTK